MLLVAALLFACARGDAMEDFLGWCAQNNAILSQHVDVRDGPVRGLVAIRDISRHDLLSATPTRTMLNIEHAEVDPDVGRAFAKLRGVSELFVLGAYLAYLRHTGTSRWQPHIAVLPHHVHLPHSYSIDELALLQASPVAHAARQRKQEIDKVGAHPSHLSIKSTLQAFVEIGRALQSESIDATWLTRFACMSFAASEHVAGRRGTSLLAIRDDDGDAASSDDGQRLYCLCKEPYDGRWVMYFSE